MPRSDQQRARQQQEQREWGGEANLRQHQTLLAAKILEQRLGSKLDKFLAAVSKADLDGVLDLLRGLPQVAARAKAASAPVEHAADEPPLPFMAVPEQTEAENTSTPIGARAAPMRQQTRPEPIQLKHRQSPQLHLAYGEMRHRCIAALRDGGAITAEAVVAQMMRDKSLDPARYQDLRSDLIKRALRSLHDLERHGRVTRIGKGRGVRWALIVP